MAFSSGILFVCIYIYIWEFGRLVVESGHAIVQFVLAAEHETYKMRMLNLQLKARNRLPWHCVHFVWHSTFANKQLNATPKKQKKYQNNNNKIRHAMEPNGHRDMDTEPIIEPKHVTKYQLIRVRRNSIHKSCGAFFINFSLNATIIRIFIRIKRAVLGSKTALIYSNGEQLGREWIHIEFSALLKS